MNTTIELSMNLIERIHRLNQKFIHELWPTINEENFPEFVRRYDCLLSKKWREYEGMN